MTEYATVTAALALRGSPKTLAMLRAAHSASARRRPRSAAARPTAAPDPRCLERGSGRTLLRSDHVTEAGQVTGACESAAIQLFHQRCRAALSALETPALTSAAVLGSAAWIGTVIPAAAILAPGGAQSDVTLALKSALVGIDDNTAGLAPALARRRTADAGAPRAVARRKRSCPLAAGPIVVKIEPAARRLLATSHSTPQPAKARPPARTLRWRSCRRSGAA
jgi:hypothetical protein